MQLRWPSCNHNNQKLLNSQISEGLSSSFNADSNQKYRPDIVRIFGIQEEENEDVYQPMINVVKLQIVKYPERMTESVTECPAESRQDDRLTDSR